MGPDERAEFVAALERFGLSRIDADRVADSRHPTGRAADTIRRLLMSAVE